MEDETAMMEDFAMENFRLPQSPSLSVSASANEI